MKVYQVKIICSNCNRSIRYIYIEKGKKADTSTKENVCRFCGRKEYYKAFIQN